MKWIKLILLLVIFESDLTNRCEGRKAVGLMKRGVVPPSRARVNFQTNVVLAKVRGGAGLDRKLVAISTGAAIDVLYGGSAFMMPGTVGESAYDTKTTPALDFLGRNSAILIFVEAITLWCLLHKGTTLNTAFGATVAPLLLRACYSTLKQLPTKLGYNVASECITFVVYTVTVYSTLTNSSFVNQAMIAFGLWETLRGLVLFVKPDTYGTLSDETEKVAVRNYGNNVFSTGAFLAALALGMDAFHAFAYAWLACASLMAILTLISDDDAQAKAANLIWTAVMGVIGALALPAF